MSRPDANTGANQSSTIGLVAGLILFFGIGGAALFMGYNVFFAAKVHLVLRVTLGVIMLLVGLKFVLLGFTCYTHLSMRWRFKRTIAGMFQDGKREVEPVDPEISRSRSDHQR